MRVCFSFPMQKKATNIFHMYLFSRYMWQDWLSWAKDRHTHVGQTFNLHLKKLLTTFLFSVSNVNSTLNKSSTMLVFNVAMLIALAAHFNKLRIKIGSY